MVVSRLDRDGGFCGVIGVPGDKSISHRAVMFGALANGTTTIRNFLPGADCLATISCFRQMGIEITQCGDEVTVYGKGLRGLNKPDGVLDVGNSGTTIRLLSGILAGQSFECQITGDASIKKRPMGRVIKPLTLMGANITSVAENDCAPLSIKPASLSGIHYDSPVASAQVKSCLLLAGLYADGNTSVSEPSISRDHTELMFEAMGITLNREGTTVTVTPPSELKPLNVVIPSDISSAAYFIVAGLITPDSDITIQNVGVNSTRDGIIHVVKAMGGSIELLNERYEGKELVADIRVQTSKLHGCVIEGSLIPTLIDEIPAIAVLACFAEGKTVIKDAAELKVKESNRIDLCVNNLLRMGVDAVATEDGMIISGGRPLHGATIETKKDHRIAMSFAIAGMNAEGETLIEDSDCVEVSFPGFFSKFAELVSQ